MKHLEKDCSLQSKLSISRICKTVLSILKTANTDEKGLIAEEHDINKVKLFISLLNAELNVLELYETKDNFKVYIDFIEERHFKSEPKIGYKTFVKRFQFLNY